MGTSEVTAAVGNGVGVVVSNSEPIFDGVVVGTIGVVSLSVAITIDSELDSNVIGSLSV